MPAAARRRVPKLAAVHQPQLGQLTPLEAVLHAHGRAARQLGGRQGHVLEVGAVSCRAHLQEALGVLHVIDLVAAVAIDHLVVVPHQQPGVCGMAGTQVDIELVTGVVQPVVGQREVFRARRENMGMRATPDEVRHLGFVDVIAHEEHEVEVCLGDFTVDGEGALFVVLARGQGQAQAARVALRIGGGA